MAVPTFLFLFYLLTCGSCVSGNISSSGDPWKVLLFTPLPPPHLNAVILWVRGAAGKKKHRERSAPSTSGPSALRSCLNHRITPLVTSAWSIEGGTCTNVEGRVQILLGKPAGKRRVSMRRANRPGSADSRARHVVTRHAGCGSAAGSCHRMDGWLDGWSTDREHRVGPSVVRTGSPARYMGPQHTAVFLFLIFPSYYPQAPDCCLPLTLYR